MEKGVHERVRLTKVYEKRREELERQHDEVRLRLEERKNKVRCNKSLHMFILQYCKQKVSIYTGVKVNSKYMFLYLLVASFNSLPTAC